MLSALLETVRGACLAVRLACIPGRANSRASSVGDLVDGAVAAEATELDSALSAPVGPLRARPAAPRRPTPL